MRKIETRGKITGFKLKIRKFTLIADFHAEDGTELAIQIGLPKTKKRFKKMIEWFRLSIEQKQRFALTNHTLSLLPGK